MAKDIKDDAPYADFAKRLRKLRLEKNMSRAELSEKCGIVPATLGNYESGERMPAADIAMKMATAFDISLDEFMGKKKDKSLDKAEETHNRTEEAVDRIRRLYGNTRAKQAREMLKNAEGLFAGGELTAEEQDDYILEMQRLLIFTIEKAREKYTPKKYRTKEKAAQRAERLKEADIIAEEIRENNSSGYINPFLTDDNSED